MLYKNVIIVLVRVIALNTKCLTNNNFFKCDFCAFILSIYSKASIISYIGHKHSTVEQHKLRNLAITASIKTIRWLQSPMLTDLGSLFRLLKTICLL